MEMAEGIKTGLDAVAGAAHLSWSVLHALAATTFDLLSGRQLPQPDLKSIAQAPEPGAINRIRLPKSIPRPSRSTARHDEAA
jgi:hypothetical protein